MVLLFLLAPVPGMGQVDYEMFPDINGLDKQHNYPVYHADNLWDYINGAADYYVSYNFSDLHIAEYTKGKRYTIKVEIYRHIDPTHAFGIYSQERSPGFDYVDIGTEGYHYGEILNFLNDQYYVKVFSSSDKKRAFESMKEVAKLVSDGLDQSPELPGMLKALPPEGMKPKSEVFIAKNFLGHEFINSVFEASYQKEEDEFEIFILRREDPSDCRNLLSEYFAFVEGSARIVTEGSYTMDDPYNGKIELVWTGNIIYGIRGTENPFVIDHYKELVEERLKN